MLVDVTAQLDKTQRLLRQLLAAKSGSRSEQLSADQLRLFAQELGAEFLSRGTREEGRRFQQRSRRRWQQQSWREANRADVAHCLRISSANASCMIWRRRTSIAPLAIRIYAASVKKSSERYEYIPAQMLVIEDACQKYACACTVKTAGKPAQPIEKSTAGASLLAHVIVSKLADHLPVHRQAKMLRRFGVEIADQTMCGWMRQTRGAARSALWAVEGFRAAVESSRHGRYAG